MLWRRLNESPYEKVGKSENVFSKPAMKFGLNESPYEKVGKSGGGYRPRYSRWRLNESPYEKVGKCEDLAAHDPAVVAASMKVPTKK